MNQKLRTMSNNEIKKAIGQLDNKISVSIKTNQEREARERLKDERLKMVGELERRKAPGYELPKSKGKGTSGIFISGSTTIGYGKLSNNK